MNYQFKTWVSVNKRALANNISALRKHLKPKTQLWAVIKSNAYGHGLWHVAMATEQLVDGYCVDSVIEGVKLRVNGIDKPILVLGPTFPNLHNDAAAHDITLSVSTMESLQELVKTIKDPRVRPAVHLKVDTGMNRQGFRVEELSHVFSFIKKHKINLTGIFSHLASAKDINYPTFSRRQRDQFEAAISIARQAGFKRLTKHIAATAGAMVSQDYHYDAVRCGIGIYGLYPSNELEVQLAEPFSFQPALSWLARISEVKAAAAGEFIGYDFTERLTRKTTIAIVPIGYWHGLPWTLSGIGSLLVGGKRAKILGRVSMDLVAVDVTDTKAKVGDIATIIGTQGKETITAREIARLTHTTPYEIITRINPLIHRTIN